MPALTGILETALYVDDLDRSVAFYRALFGFDEVARDGERLVALGVASGQVLLIFRKRASPDHDGSGQLHLAFAIPSDALAVWEERLNECGIAIVERRVWERGGRSVYFRDPDGHLLELATPGVWINY